MRQAILHACLLGALCIGGAGAGVVWYGWPPIWMPVGVVLGALSGMLRLWFWVRNVDTPPERGE